jgi:hypothetical protein
MRTLLMSMIIFFAMVTSSIGQTYSIDINAKETGIVPVSF